MNITVFVRRLERTLLRDAGRLVHREYSRNFIRRTRRRLYGRGFMVRKLLRRKFQTSRARRYSGHERVTARAVTRTRIAQVPFTRLRTQVTWVR